MSEIDTDGMPPTPGPTPERATGVPFLQTWIWKPAERAKERVKHTLTQPALVGWMSRRAPVGAPNLYQSVSAATSGTLCDKCPFARQSLETPAA